MKIAIIGKVNPGLTYEEWVCKFQTNVDITNITQINITNSDLVVGFQQKGSSKESWKLGECLLCGKDAKIIIC